MRGQLYHQGDQTAYGRYRIAGDKLWVSIRDSEGDYIENETPHKLTIEDGTVTAIDSWERMESGTSHPEYVAIRVGS